MTAYLYRCSVATCERPWQFAEQRVTGPRVLCGPHQRDVDDARAREMRDLDGVIPFDRAASRPVPIWTREPRGVSAREWVGWGLWTWRLWLPFAVVFVVAGAVGACGWVTDTRLLLAAGLALAGCATLAGMQARDSAGRHA